MNLHQPRSQHNLITWSTLKGVFSSPISKSAIVVPFVGYLILFNDSVAQALSFKEITNAASTMWLSSKTRLQLVYFGLLFLAIATIWYRSRCPIPVKQAGNNFDYRAFAFENFSISDFLLVFSRLENSRGYGLYDDTQFDRDHFHKFIDASMPDEPSSDLFTNEDLWFALANVTDRDGAIRNSKEFLCNLLDANYDYAKHSRRKELLLLTSVTAFGFIFLAIPSIDVFLSVVSDIVNIPIS